jgi:hypothetical protein
VATASIHMLRFIRNPPFPRSSQLDESSQPQRDYWLREKHVAGGGQSAAR